MVELRFVACLGFCVVVGCGGSKFAADDDGAGGSSGGARDGGSQKAGSGGRGGAAGAPGDASAGEGGTGGEGAYGGSTTDGGPDAGPMRDAAADAPLPPNSGDCTLGETCPTGECVELTPGGYRVCSVPPTEVTHCREPRSADDTCCSHDDCKQAGLCLQTPLTPSCGSPVIKTNTMCATDQCSADSQCPAGNICVPAGTLGRKVRMCVPASCHRDADCTAHARGVCAPVAGGCCHEGIVGLYCVYPKQGCRSNANCADMTSGGACLIDADGASYCAPVPPVCG